jgi:hypothetical protein
MPLEARNEVFWRKWEYPAMVIRDTPSFNEKFILIKRQPDPPFMLSKFFFSSLYPTGRSDKNTGITSAT